MNYILCSAQASIMIDDDDDADDEAWTVVDAWAEVYGPTFLKGFHACVVRS